MSGAAASSEAEAEAKAEAEDSHSAEVNEVAVKAKAVGQAEAEMNGRSAARLRQSIDFGLMALVGAYAISALVGLPLFQDGAWYFFTIATQGVAELPNLRYTALLPQLPTVWAAPLVDDAVLLRHLFSFSYVALPVASLLGCWLLVRRQAPELMLFPLLWFLLNLVNFSGVSELLSSLYLSWPLVLAMLIAPQRASTRVYAGIAAPMLLTLHPLAFLPAFALALLAAALAWLRPSLRRVWGRLAGILAAAGLLRLLWTAVGANDYERGRLEGDSALHYLMTETFGQHLLLAAVLALGVLLAAGMLAHRLMPGARCGPMRDWSLQLSGAIAWLLLPIIVLIGVEILNGDGIKLKSGLSFLIGLVLMGLASVVVLLPSLLAVADHKRDQTVPDRRTRIAAPIATPIATPIAALMTISMVVLLLAKSAAWWTATRGLQNVLAESQADCISMSASEPFGLQWPWMSIIDDWVTPMNALAFRPYLVLQPDRGIEPVPLLLRDDRCEIARATGTVYVNSWIQRDWAVVEQRFGPLR
jgi:hypothetical protein